MKIKGYLRNINGQQDIRKVFDDLDAILHGSELSSIDMIPLCM